MSSQANKNILLDFLLILHGKIIEYGTHEELIRNQGEYFYLLEKTSSSVYTAKT